MSTWLFSLTKLQTTGCASTHSVRGRVSSETLNEVPRHGPDVFGLGWPPNERRAGANINENWYVPEVAVAPFQHQKPRGMSLFS